MEENKDKEYHFLKEETKKVPANKKKICKTLGIVILFAAVCGVVASVIFCLVKPAIEDWQEKKNAQVHPQEEDPDTTQQPEQIIVQETVELSIEEYEALQTQLYAVGSSAAKSVVEINSVTNETDWFEEDFETRGSSSGVILEMTENHILILTETDMIADASKIRVTFYGNEKADAILKAHDGNTGLAILSVSKDTLSRDAYHLITPIQMSSQDRLWPGSFVIGVGSPQGEAFSVAVGNVTASDRKISFADCNYRFFATDIQAYENTRGVLLNVKGELVGIICQNSDNGAVRAIAASEVKNVLEKLKVGKRPAYMGVEISEVTLSVTEEYGLPDGVFIKNIDMDSPAVAGGLQVGDIIVAMDGKEVLTEVQLENFMATAEPEQKVRVTVKRLGSGDTYHDVTCNLTLGVAE